MHTIGELIPTDDGSWTVKHPGNGQNFHSTEGAKFEAWQLYVVASGLPAALSEQVRVRVLDVGMGLGYNAAATIVAWLESPGQADLDLLSLELDPHLVQVLVDGLAPWCEGWSESWRAGPRALKKSNERQFSAQIEHPLSHRVLHWSINVGDASLGKWRNGELFEFVWQDPFTPELNPVLWSVEWFEMLRSVSHAKTLLMTYSVSRIVKDALNSGNWAYKTFDTPGRKRHWLRCKPK
ncbi:MAG: MnmC family methyltransferase [Proteobacteria bacterium]|nr:MnmC family methyltransferase [Pseudomonadota bacterium]